MKLTTRAIAKSGIIAALYVALTLPLGSLAVQPFIQIRPAEALTLLPLLMPSSIVGLAVGCGLVNLISSSAIDMLIGGLLTLTAGIMTKCIKNPYLGGIPPVLVNAIGLPIVFSIMGYDMAYWYMFFQILISQTIWVYGLGLPLYFTMKKMSEKNDWLLK